MIEQVLTGSLDDVSDVDAAVALARLVHDEFESFGTGATRTSTTAWMMATPLAPC